MVVLEGLSGTLSEVKNHLLLSLCVAFSLFSTAFVSIGAYLIFHGGSFSIPFF